ncbi:MAG: hypothetical protein HYS62_00490 [Candidatus Aenigmarchaeota archaeon]|nr:hypothetical protein [Candidatus Aenigmarchaeota archaeon]
MSIRELVEVELGKDYGVLSRIHLMQLRELEPTERTAEELGYIFSFDPRVPMVTFYREKQHPLFPWYVIDNFHLIPNLPYWVEGSGLIDRYNGILRKPPSDVEREVIDVLAERHKEIRLSVEYSHIENNQLIGISNREVQSVQELDDLLRNPPKDHR